MRVQLSSEFRGESVDEVDEEILVIAGCALGLLAPGQPPQVLRVQDTTEEGLRQLMDGDQLVAVDGQDARHLARADLLAALRKASVLDFTRPEIVIDDDDDKAKSEIDEPSAPRKVVRLERAANKKTLGEKSREKPREKGDKENNDKEKGEKEKLYGYGHGQGYGYGYGASKLKLKSDAKGKVALKSGKAADRAGAVQRTPSQKKRQRELPLLKPGGVQDSRARSAPVARVRLIPRAALESGLREDSQSPDHRQSDRRKRRVAADEGRTEIPHAKGSADGGAPAAEPWPHWPHAPRSTALSPYGWQPQAQPHPHRHPPHPTVHHPAAPQQHPPPVPGSWGTPHPPLYGHSAPYGAWHAGWPPPTAYPPPHAAGPPPGAPPPTAGPPPGGHPQDRIDDASAMLVVQRLPAHLNRRDVLSDYFGMFGLVKSVHPNSACSEAVVTFAHPDHAKAAMSRYVFNDPSIYLQLWKGQSASRAAASSFAESASANMTLSPADIAANKRRARDEIDEKRKALLYNLTEQLKAILAKVADPNVTEKNKEALQAMMETIQKKIRTLTPRQELESYEKIKRAMHGYAVPEVVGWMPAEFAMEERLQDEEHAVVDQAEDMDRLHWAEGGAGFTKPSEGEEGGSAASAAGAPEQVVSPVPPPMGASPPKPANAVWTAPSSDEVRRQIEYYLSDQNLCRDKFFHARISESPDGWLDLQLILNCKRIRSMGVKREDIIGALAESEVEVHELGNAIRRPRNAPLPQLDGDEGVVSAAAAANFGKGTPLPAQPAIEGSQGSEEALRSSAPEEPPAVRSEAPAPAGPEQAAAVETASRVPVAIVVEADAEESPQAFDDADFEPVDEVQHPWSGVMPTPEVPVEALAGEARPSCQSWAVAEHVAGQPQQPEEEVAQEPATAAVVPPAQQGDSVDEPDGLALWQ